MMTPVFTDVFKRHLPRNYRIPSVVATRDGTLLAFCESRAYPSDQARNRIVVKRSQDLGMTWSNEIIIDDRGKDSLNNPVPVVLGDSGRILLMYQDYPSPAIARDVVPGWEDPGTKRWIRLRRRPLRVVKAYLTWSDDDGNSWAPPLDVTRSIKEPTSVTTLSSGPGIGIRLRGGGNEGRILVPFNEGVGRERRVFMAMSDDGGETWRAGNRVPNDHLPGTGDENQVAELSDGFLVVNSRVNGRPGCRAVATSRDGGATWEPFRLEPRLPDPGCQGSLISVGNVPGVGPDVLMFSNPSHPRKRVNGQVKLSPDGGKTWPVSKNIQEPRKVFAYSCLVPLPDGTYGCLFEAGSPYIAKRLVFARFDLEWLTDGMEMG